ncbi:MAG: AraC family transcriptional regulator [Pseudomonadota bacterium]
MLDAFPDPADSVPKITGSNITELVDRAGALGVFDVDHESSERNTVFQQSRFTGGTHQAVVECSDVAVLVLTMEGEGSLHAEYDDTAFDSDVRPGVFTWAPRGVSQFYDFIGRTTNVATTFPTALLDQIREQDPELRHVTLDEAWAPFTQFRLQRLIAEQNRLVASGELGWRSLADAHMVQLAVELMCFAGNKTPRSCRPLSPKELSRVEDYVRSHLDHNVALVDVAALLDRPVSGFCRAFRAASGESFHRFALTARLMEAQRLLTETEMPVIEIAYATGFSSQSHLTSTMNSKQGITPGRLRTEARRAQ